MFLSCVDRCYAVGQVQLDGTAAAPGGEADGAGMGGADRVEGVVGDWRWRFTTIKRVDDVITVIKFSARLAFCQNLTQTPIPRSKSLLFSISVLGAGAAHRDPGHCGHRADPQREHRGPEGALPRLPRGLRPGGRLLGRPGHRQGMGLGPTGGELVRGS